uniref:Uncharacterized protein n=1 Tax=Rhizophora mucronata TaxID=61149 RepID=A0A2P2L692_RHIMU
MKRTVTEIASLILGHLFEGKWGSEIYLIQVAKMSYSEYFSSYFVKAQT